MDVSAVQRERAGAVMTVVTRQIGSTRTNAAILRDAVAQLTESEISLSSVERLCRRVLKVADRIDPPVRLADPLPQEGARRLLAAMEGLEDVIDRG